MYNIKQMYILFWFRKSEAKTEVTRRKENPDYDTLGNIACRVTIDGEAVEIGNVHIECRKSNWDPENQRLKGSSNEVKKHNKRINELKVQIERTFDLVQIEFEHVTAMLVKEFVTQKRLFRFSTQQLITEYFKDRATQVTDKKITQATVDVEENYSKNLIRYLEKEKLTSRLPRSFDETIVSGFRTYLLDVAKFAPSHSHKHIVWLKMLFKHSLKKKRLKFNPIEDCEIGTDNTKPDTTHLTVEQLSKLARFDFFDLAKRGFIAQQTAEKCDLERDAFVFNCFSGMHHIEYTNKLFQIENCKEGVFLKGSRQKTGEEFMVKLLEPALMILNKYGGEIQNLPIKSNQKRNDTLKQIAVLVGIPVVLSTKIARKTFTDIALNELMMETKDVATCLGLKNDRYLKHYARIREKRLAAKMMSWNDILKFA
ncbi:phage integrase SAM-like domain-containing protein [Runella sp. MFBS21]|uniref:phage integrase SAM-like domain-containing protein n=1 Tax=Runella sp. MFBS21 TaxID=3034018 RepID=UPI0023FA0296|nr:phage integrase SAM-like domain-containing protein [Runella sp. MFBS21]